MTLPLSYSRSLFLFYTTGAKTGTVSPFRLSGSGMRSASHLGEISRIDFSYAGPRSAAESLP